MKISQTLITLIILSNIFIIACENQKITSFEECVNAGNPVMESYPRQCRANSETFIEKIDLEVYSCSDSDRNKPCTKIYDPVCAKVNIQCITTPCEPIKETYDNACVACNNNLVESYSLGPC